MSRSINQVRDINREMLMSVAVILLPIRMNNRQTRNRKNRLLANEVLNILL
jgi:hypothetical protein